jgi:hypothetical protein
MIFLIVIDRSSPIVIPDDDDDGKSSANYGDIKIEEPDFSTSIDPTQDHPRLASQLSVNASLGKVLAGERGSSEYNISPVHHRTTDRAVGIAGLTEAAQSNDQPAKPDRYNLGYSRDREGLACKHDL